GCVTPSRVTFTVLVCPPTRSAASNRVTRCSRDSSHAQASPEMPLPTTAIFRPGPGRLRRSSIFTTQTPFRTPVSAAVILFHRLKAQGLAPQVGTMHQQLQPQAIAGFFVHDNQRHRLRLPPLSH